VARIAIIFGVLLAVLGVALYYMSDPDHKSYTAFIPSAFGAVLIVIGQVAQSDSEKVRKHSMHAAAMIGLIGLVSGIVLTVLDIRKMGTDHPPSDVALGGKAVFGLLSGVFLALCVKSFIDVRKARKLKQSEVPPPP